MVSINVLVYDILDVYYARTGKLPIFRNVQNAHERNLVFVCGQENGDI